MFEKYLTKMGLLQAHEFIRGSRQKLNYFGTNRKYTFVFLQR